MTTMMSGSTNSAMGTEPGRSRTSLWSKIENILLSALAVLGAVCIVATVAAFAFNISLIMFKTGSMSPTIPTGSLAVVKEIPASEIKVGDVITVSRGEGELPVTHRVLSTAPIGGSTYSVEMKGDANDGPDPRPYEVTEVRKVYWHVPGLAYAVAAVSQPKYMAAITLAASLLVVWAFWPRPHDTKSRDSE